MMARFAQGPVRAKAGANAYDGLRGDHAGAATRGLVLNDRRPYARGPVNRKALRRAELAVPPPSGGAPERGEVSVNSGNGSTFTANENLRGWAGFFTVPTLTTVRFVKLTGNMDLAGGVTRQMGVLDSSGQWLAYALEDDARAYFDTEGHTAENTYEMNATVDLAPGTLYLFGAVVVNGAPGTGMVAAGTDRAGSAGRDNFQPSGASWGGSSIAGLNIHREATAGVTFADCIADENTTWPVEPYGGSTSGFWGGITDISGTPPWLGAAEA